jgi:hypothetical protein
LAPYVRTGKNAAEDTYDANASKSHLRDVAARLEVKGRTKMNKGELVDAIMRVNRRKTDQARRQR